MAPRGVRITFTLEAMSHRQSSYRLYYRVTIADVREMQPVQRNTRVQTLTQSLTSRLSDDRANRPSGENESSSIAAIDNGHMSGYGIGLLYRRIRGRLSCQSAYRAPLINPRKQGLLSFLT